MKFDIVTQWVISTAERESPTCPKLSRQVSSEIRGQTWQQESGAGWSEAAGRDIEPRNLAHRGHWITSGKLGVKVDVVGLTEGSSPGCDLASNQDTTGVW